MAFLIPVGWAITVGVGAAINMIGAAAYLKFKSMK
jgi:hypothetical protein